MNVDFFDPITITLPREKIYSRLGYSKGITQLTPQQQKTTERHIEDALTFIDLKGAALRVPITKVTASWVVLSGGIVFESKSLASLLANCEQLLLMAVTAGSDITDAISRESAAQNITKAVVFDAVASEMTDTGLGWIEDLFNRQICRENKLLTSKRFSAGYGDFLLSNQKAIYEVLELSRYGVNLSKEYIFKPEKTVTAVAGILDKK